MKILFADKKKGIKKIRVDSIDDLWHISNILHKNDVVEANTFRAVKFGNKEERKPVFLGLSVESVEFSKLKKSLRINGKILYGKPEEFIQKSRYHTIEVKPGDTLTIIKEWMFYELSRLNEAVKQSRIPKAVIILVEEKKILIANVLSYGIETDEISIYKSKKEGSELDEKDLSFLLRLNKDLFIIIAGPGFSKFKVSEFMRKHGYNVKVEDASYAEISGIVELVNRGVIGEALSSHNLEVESKLLGEFEKHLFREDGLVAYGIKEVKNAIDHSAVKTLLMLDDYITDEKFRGIAKEAENKGSEVKVISSTSPWGKKLKGYGGLAAILRFRIN